MILVIEKREFVIKLWEVIYMSDAKTQTNETSA